MALEGLNEKLKNLGKKKPDASGAPARSRSGGVTEFFNKNPFMKFVIPVVLFVLISAVFLIAVFGDGVIMNGGDDVTQSGAEGSTSVAEVVPQAEIVDGTTDAYIAGLIANDPFSEDILASAHYKGAVIYSTGLRTAIVENGGVVYTLNVGDKIGTSAWAVVEITENNITFSSGSVTKTISK